jgi:uncharacterized protein with GYD domain
VKTYITLLRYTEKGIEALKRGFPSREEIAQLCRSCGASLIEFHWVAGNYDSVLVCEAPDSKTLTGVLDKLDGCRTETLSVFSEEQFREVIRDRPLPKALGRLVSKGFQRVRHT